MSSDATLKLAVRKIKDDLLDIVRSSLKCAAIRELAEFLGETFEVLLGFQKLLILLVVGGSRQRQAVLHSNHRGEQHHRHVGPRTTSLKA